MKNWIKLFGIIALVAVMGFSIASCKEEPEEVTPTDITITNIGAQYNNKVAITGVVTTTGGNTNVVAIGVYTKIVDAKATWYLLDEDGKNVSIEGTYTVMIMIYDDMQHTGKNEEIYTGFLINQKVAKEGNSYNFGSFISQP